MYRIRVVLRRLLLIAVPTLSLTLGACGGDDGPTQPTAARVSTTTPAATPRPATTPQRDTSPQRDTIGRIASTDGVRQRVLGRRARTVTVLEGAGQSAGARPVVVFLHGWGAIDPRFYAPWLVHLVRGGSTVIYPRYQSSVITSPATVLGNTVAALRTAFAVVPPADGRLVVAGHSAGGALGADYAAMARDKRLPVPAAVFSVYPGRSLRGGPAVIPPVDQSGIPAAVRILALGSEADETVGTATARQIGRLGRYVRVTDARVDDHLAPLRTDRVAQATFWAPLDRLIERARRAAGGRSR